ncbi:MAG: universal stress protein [Halobacteriales archaeon]
MADIDRVLVADDGTPLATTALEYALEVYTAASITVMYVIDHVQATPT